ncbi:MAG TPA: MarR family winged helix-turn-helix transcriptional regulator [Devosia sp.]|nr:MarR family winged helix-turn-helix transcriptional regulator [Devosia sp.]
MQFDQRETIGFRAAQLSRLISNRLREALAPLGVQPAQAAALIEIAACEGMTQKDLVERLDVEQPGVARTLSGLEAEGWIERRAKAGRAQGLYLTAKAQAVVPEARRIWAEVNEQAVAELSRTERAHLIDALSQLVAEFRHA